MHDRTLLGPADVTDAELAGMVARLLGEDPASVELLSSRAEEVPYDIPAITTAGRHWVSGTARTPSGTTPYRMFVKQVQSWSRSPLFAEVPADYREMAAASVPWRTEGLAYASDLGDRLPEGLSMPRSLGVHDLDELSMAIWLEAVDRPAVTWDLERYRRAAYLLGRMAASPTVAPLADVGAFEWSVRSYVFGRLDMQVLPVLRDDGVWQHPAIAEAFGDDLRDRLRAAALRVDGWLEELDRMPVLTTHGDYSPNNLLPGPTPDGFTLIDFGFWMPNPIGYDLGQLLVGDVQLGRCSPATLAGDRGGDPARVRRGAGGRGHGRGRSHRTALARPPADDLHRLLGAALRADRLHLPRGLPARSQPTVRSSRGSASTSWSRLASQLEARVERVLVEHLGGGAP